MPAKGTRIPFRMPQLNGLTEASPRVCPGRVKGVASGKPPGVEIWAVVTLVARPKIDLPHNYRYSRRHDNSSMTFNYLPLGILPLKECEPVLKQSLWARSSPTFRTPR